MIENEKIKFYKHFVINEVDETLIGKYTILDFSKSWTYYKEDKHLISGFIKILEYMEKFIDNIARIVFDKKKPIEQLEKNKLYIFLEDMFKNLMKRINIIDRINNKDTIVAIKENLKSMISNIDKHKKKFKYLKNNISNTLNKELEKFKNVDIEFKLKTETIFDEMINKWEKISSKEMEKKRNEVFENFKKRYHDNYLNVFEDINKKIISYTNAQNDAFLSRGKIYLI